jgi:hypothetical protein
MPVVYPCSGPPLPGETLREYIDRTICRQLRLTPEGQREAREMARWLEPSFVVTPLTPKIRSLQAGWAVIDLPDKGMIHIKEPVRVVRLPPALLGEDMGDLARRMRERYSTKILPKKD